MQRLAESSNAESGKELNNDAISPPRNNRKLSTIAVSPVDPRTQMPIIKTLREMMIVSCGVPLGLIHCILIQNSEYKLFERQGVRAKIYF
jgi:hypothetical protein